MINKAIILGRLGQDPEVRYTPQGSAVANLSAATSERWKDKEGNQQERTEWHRIVAWGKLAEIAKNYLKKGNQVYVEGKLQTRQWEKDGKTNYTTEIMAERILRVGSNGKPEDPQDDGYPVGV